VGDPLDIPGTGRCVCTASVEVLTRVFGVLRCRPGGWSA
jgi:hypothetical protein